MESMTVSVKVEIKYAKISRLFLYWVYADVKIIKVKYRSILFLDV